MKINVDGAFTPGTNAGSVAGVCRDENGVLLGGFARTVKAQSPLNLETLAICEGLERCEMGKGKRVTRGGC